jgi:hypothetical protein
VTRLREIDRLLQQIRTVVLELQRLEGDGVDGLAVTSRRRELERLKAHLADLVSHDPGLIAA